MAKRKRANGEGSIFKRKNGTWAASVSTRDMTGRRKRRTMYGRTRAAVAEKLTRLQSQKLNGTLTDATNETVAEFMDRWLRDSAKPTTAATTFVRYSGIVHNHINPRIGGVKLAKLTPANIQAMYSAMEATGNSATSRAYVHSIIRRALNVAVRWGLILRNPCSAVDAAKPEPKEIQPLTREQTQVLLKESEPHRLHALFVLAVISGLRQGELFALHWENVDLNAGFLSVRHTLEEIAGTLRLKEPKSASSRRKVELPRIAVDALREHRKRMMAEGNAGTPWVFCDSDGGPLRKSNVTRRVWKPIRDDAGLPAIRFHDLRHTCATLLLGEDVHPKVVQEQLGHSKISLTLDTYSHILPSMQKLAAEKMNRLFPPKTASVAVRWLYLRQNQLCGGK